MIGWRVHRLARVAASVAAALLLLAGNGPELRAAAPWRSGDAPAADTLIRRFALAFLPSAELLAPGLLTFTTGYVSPFTGAEGDPPGAGTGNQSYQGDIGLGIAERLELRLGIEVNDDPTWAPIRGERIEKSLVALALAARTVLWTSAAGPGAGETPAADAAARRGRDARATPPIWALGLQASVQIHWQGSAPGLFNAGPLRDERVHAAFALGLPLTFRPDPRLTMTVVPSVATLPSRLMGAPYYGTMARLGAEAHVRPGARWTVSGAGELSLGPGDNVVDRTAALSRTATWRAGVRWQGTDRVVLDGYLTNAAGVTPATRHLTLPGDPRVLYGVGITYTPSVAEPDVDAARAREAASHAPGGVGLAAFRTLAPGRGLLETTADARGAWAIHAQQALGRRFQIEVLATRLAGADAPRILEVDVGSSWEYRVAGELALADEAEGDRLSWAHRVSIGRDGDDQQGYLLAEIVASRRLLPGARLVLNPVTIHTAGRSPASLGVGARLGEGAVIALLEGRGSFTGEQPVWAVGLAAPAGLAGLPLPGARLYATTAAGPRELGRVLAAPGGWRIGVTLSFAW